MLFTFLLIVQTIVATLLVTVILMQRSEGGGLGVGGSSAGRMTARGAAEVLTRATAVLAAIFIILSITLAAIAGVSGTGRRSTHRWPRSSRFSRPRRSSRRRPLRSRLPPAMKRPRLSRSHSSVTLFQLI